MPVFVRWFPLWALIASAAALWLPLAGLAPAITPLLMLIMLGMGLNLSLSDFRAVAQKPGLIALGLALQYTAMPLAAWLTAYLLHLGPELMLGLILVGAASGGTASNVMTYLAGGNLALSVSLTALSTLAAVVMTPLWVLLLAGRSIPVPAASMLATVAQVALVPVLLGMALRAAVPRIVGHVEPWLPAISVAGIVAVIAIIVAVNRGNIARMAAPAALAVALHNSLGLLAGYGVAKGLRANERDARTLAIEVGMQNSGLAVVLALKFFSPAAALPGALFSIWHNISGSLLASYWQRRSLAA